MLHAARLRPQLPSHRLTPFIHHFVTQMYFKKGNLWPMLPCLIQGSVPVAASNLTDSLCRRWFLSNNLSHSYCTVPFRWVTLSHFQKCLCSPTLRSTSHSYFSSKRFVILSKLLALVVTVTCVCLPALSIQQNCHSPISHNFKTMALFFLS